MTIDKDILEKVQCPPCKEGHPFYCRSLDCKRIVQLVQEVRDSGRNNNAKAQGLVDSLKEEIKLYQEKQVHKIPLWIVEEALAKYEEEI